MFLEISNNNRTKYIRIRESVRILDKDSNKSIPKKKSFNINTPKKCFKRGEIKQLKSKMKMSM